MISSEFISLLAFPVNLILALSWVYLMFFLFRNCRKSVFVRFLLSPGATFLSIGLFLLYCIIIGVTGRRELIHTWVFVLIMLLLQSVLLSVILRGWREKTATGARLGSLRWRFLFLHVGLLIAISSAFWGAPDSESCRVKAWMGEPVSEAFRQDGKSVWLKYDMLLEDFTLSYGPDGKPSDYAAKVKVDGEDVVLRVNHPYARSFGEDIYLSGYDQSACEVQYCILEIVREPWKYTALAGVILMLAGALMLFIGGPKVSKGNDD